MNCNQEELYFLLIYINNIGYSKLKNSFDINLLKKIIWKSFITIYNLSGEQVRFSDVILFFISEKNKADYIRCYSFHLFFICILHLAFENELTLKNTTAFDNIYIR